MLHPSRASIVLRALAADEAALIAGPGAAIDATLPPPSLVAGTAGSTPNVYTDGSCHGAGTDFAM
eukprot:3829154-Alexandrium_andersonii.AAC.1